MGEHQHDEGTHGMPDVEHRARAALVKDFGQVIGMHRHAGGAGQVVAAPAPA